MLRMKLSLLYANIGRYRHTRAVTVTAQYGIAWYGEAYSRQ